MLQKYDPMWLPYDSGSVKMDEDCEGEYVKFDDVKTEINKLAGLIDNANIEVEPLLYRDIVTRLRDIVK